MNKVKIEKNNTIVKFVAYTKDFSPTFYENNTTEYVQFGEDNKLPYLIKDLYNSVSIHKGIIEKKKLMIKEKGIGLENENDRDALIFYDKVNESDNFETLFDKILIDWLVYGGAYLQIIWSRDGSKINKIYHMHYDAMRCGKFNEKGQIEKYYYNPNISKSGQYKKYTNLKDLIEFEAFSEFENKNVPQIYFLKSYDPTSYYYSMPDYSASLTDLDTLRQITLFHNANIINGMQPSVYITFPGQTPSPERQDNIVKQLKEKYAGPENASRPLIFFGDNNSTLQPVISTIESSDNDKMYQELYKTTIQNIITSHQIPRILANVATEGSLGSSKEYIDAEKIFYKNYVKPTQEVLLSKLNVIFDINGYSNIMIIKSEPDLTYYTIEELLKLYTPEQVIELLGMPTLKK